MLKKIISGGQTGADRGALDAARELGFAYGGFLPARRKTEAGPLPDEYLMEELDSPNYPVRTAANVQAGDGTLILSRGALKGGSALTLRIAREKSKPCLHLDLTKVEDDTAVKKIECWIKGHRLEILNVAGPRASSDDLIYDSTRRLIVAVIKACCGEPV